MPRPLKWGILGASTIILSKDIDKYAFMYGSNFNEADVRYLGSGQNNNVCGLGGVKSTLLDPIMFEAVSFL